MRSSSRRSNARDVAASAGESPGNDPENSAGARRNSGRPAPARRPAPRPARRCVRFSGAAAFTSEILCPADPVPPAAAAWRARGWRRSASRLLLGDAAQHGKVKCDCAGGSSSTPSASISSTREPRPSGSGQIHEGHRLALRDAHGTRFGQMRETEASSTQSMASSRRRRSARASEKCCARNPASKAAQHARARRVRQPVHREARGSRSSGGASVKCGSVTTKLPHLARGVDDDGQRHACQRHVQPQAPTNALRLLAISPYYSRASPRRVGRVCASPSRRRAFPQALQQSDPPPARRCRRPASAPHRRARRARATASTPRSIVPAYSAERCPNWRMRSTSASAVTPSIGFSEAA